MTKNRHVDVSAAVEAGKNLAESIVQPAVPTPIETPASNKPPMRRLKLHNAYRGKRTREATIPAGEYDEDNPALLNLADFLVESGHADWIESR